MSDTHPPRRVVRFGSYEVDLRAGELRKNGIKIRLQEKPFRILAALLERPGDLVTREQLFKMLWSKDTFVAFDGSLNTAAGKLRTALGDSADNPRFVETLPRRGYRFIAPVEEQLAAPAVAAETTRLLQSSGARRDQGGVSVGQTISASGPPEKSIAVLPFQNFSSESEQEYFCDGITEELINALTQVEGVRVVARTSAFAFKGQYRDIRKIGEDLNVGTVVEGSVRKAGERLRITAQLINTPSGYHLWSQRYDRNLTDVFAIQEEISQSIVKALSIRLVGQVEQPLVNTYTNDLEAYNFYLKGLHRWHKQTKEDMKSAVQNFEQAVKLDPKFAPAYVGVSDCYRLLGWWGAAPPQEAMGKAKAAALKAVGIDDTFGAAHRVLAGVKGHTWEDWPGSERGFRKAIELNPSDAITHASYGIVLLFPMGRAEGAIEQLRQARDLDPLSAFHTTCLGWALHMGKRFDEAIEQACEALELDPGFYLAHLVKGWAYEQKSQLDEALDSFEQARSSAGPISVVVGSLAHCNAMSGATKEATKLLNGLKEISAQRYVPPLDIAVVYAALREKETALEWLDKAYTDRTPRLSTVRLDPRFDSLRAEPRFTALLGKMGLTGTVYTSKHG